MNSFENDIKFKRRYVKDLSLPINIFEPEEVWRDRINLFNSYDAYLQVCEELEDKFGSVDEYFAYYNRVKDGAIETIKDSKAFNMLNNYDMNTFTVKNIPSSVSKDVYKETNKGKYFVSIDIRKANFTALSEFSKRYCGEKFLDCDTYEDFISIFTDIEYVKKSKYIRQVIFGNCNPKRQTGFEKHLINEIRKIINLKFPEAGITSLVTDEIVYEFGEDKKAAELFKREVASLLDTSVFKVEMFFLNHNDDFGYYEKITKDKVILKCVSPLIAPFAKRVQRKEEYKPTDYLFVHEGFLAKLLSAPFIES